MPVSVRKIQASFLDTSKTVLGAIGAEINGQLSLQLAKFGDQMDRVSTVLETSNKNVEDLSLEVKSLKDDRDSDREANRIREEKNEERFLAFGTQIMDRSVPGTGGESWFTFKGDGVPFKMKRGESTKLWIQGFPRNLSAPRRKSLADEIVAALALRPKDSPFPLANAVERIPGASLAFATSDDADKAFAMLRAAFSSGCSTKATAGLELRVVPDRCFELKRCGTVLASTSPQRSTLRRRGGAPCLRSRTGRLGSGRTP